MRSKTALKQIIDSANIQRRETVLEIGPGEGVLTLELLKTGAKVLVIEKDSRAVILLKEKFTDEIRSGFLTLLEGDVLDDNILEKLPIKEGEYALVANIPYYITGAILEKFLEYSPRPNRMVLLVQKEVAERIVARDKKESILSISVKAFGKPNIISKVPRGAFVPPPNVDSAILSIENISDKLFTENNIDIKTFFQVLKTGFAHKRKIIKSNLAEIIKEDSLNNIWRENKLKEKVRAEDLGKEDWVNIVKNVDR